MKENNELLDKRLREAFNEIVLETPSPDFVENLMVRVEREAAKAQRQRAWITCGQIAMGVCAMILLPALAIYLCRIYVPGFTFVFTFPTIDLHLDPNLIAIGLTVLLLLMADTLLRKHARSKETE